MINRFLSWLLKCLFSFDRPVIRCKRPGCNRPLRTELSRMRGFSDSCWRKFVEEEQERLMRESTKNMEEIDRELQPK